MHCGHLVVEFSVDSLRGMVVAEIKNRDGAKLRENHLCNQEIARLEEAQLLRMHLAFGVDIWEVS